MDHYYAYVCKDDDSDFGIDFPDLPGCVSAVSTLEEAFDGAEDVLALHVAGLCAEGMAVPAPSTLGGLPGDDDIACVLRVPLRPVKGKSVRVQITLDEFLLREIDDRAAATGMTRSGLLAAAARGRLKSDNA